MDPFDPTRLALPAGAVGKPKPSKRPPRHKAGERFLRGPIPWQWLEVAGRLPGKALHVGVALWHLSGIKDDRTVKWEPSAVKQWQLNRLAVYRGLKALERAKLVAVDRRNGRCAVVTILAQRAANVEDCARAQVGSEP